MLLYFFYCCIESVIFKVWNLTRTKPLFANRDQEYTCSNKKNDRNKIKRPDTLPLRVGFRLNLTHLERSYL